MTVETLLRLIWMALDGEMGFRSALDVQAFLMNGLLEFDDAPVG